MGFRAIPPSQSKFLPALPCDKDVVAHLLASEGCAGAGPALALRGGCTVAWGHGACLGDVQKKAAVFLGWGWGAIGHSVTEGERGMGAASGGSDVYCCGEMRYRRRRKFVFFFGRPPFYPPCQDSKRSDVCGEIKCG